MAKQRQVFVNARLGQLKKRMGELALVNLANIPRDRAAFGSTGRCLRRFKDEKIEYKLVTSEESDVSQGLISTTSPIGRGLVASASATSLPSSRQMGSGTLRCSSLRPFTMKPSPTPT